MKTQNGRPVATDDDPEADAEADAGEHDRDGDGVNEEVA
jgi:hypothetical protein